MRIGFDLDGVLYDWHNATYEYAVDFLGVKDTMEVFYRGSTEHIYPEMFWSNIIRIPFLYTKYGIKKELSKMLDKLAKNNELFYITHRPSEARLATNRWLEVNNIPYKENIIFTSNKSLEIRRNNIKLFIDDDPRVIKALNNICNTIYVFHPWWDVSNTTFKFSVKHILDLPEKIKELIGDY